MPLSAPFADGVVPFAPLVGAGDPWAWARVVWAGGFCEPNFELMLFIHELRRDGLFESGGVVPPFSFSVLPRLSSVGRFGTFCGGVVAAFCGSCGGDCDAGFSTAGAGANVVLSARPLLGVECSSWCGLDGRPPCEDVLGGASRVSPGEDGACGRWWWSVRRGSLVRPLRISGSQPHLWSSNGAATIHRRRGCLPWLRRCRAVLARLSLCRGDGRHALRRGAGVRPAVKRNVAGFAAR